MRDHKQVEVIEDCQEAIWEIRSELASLAYLLKEARVRNGRENGIIQEFGVEFGEF